MTHRDFKPGNIVAHDYGSGDRVYKVIDFGLAALKLPPDATRLTMPFTFLGTMAYAAPEQLAGESVGPAANRYSLGVIAYEMLTGRRPFDAVDPLVLAQQVISGATTPPSGDPPGIAAAADPAILRAMARRADERWPSVSAFVDALAAALAGTVESGHDASPSRGRGPAGALRRRRDAGPRPAGQHRSPRHPSRARRPGGDPSPQARRPAALGRPARAIPARGPDAAGAASASDAGPRLRRGRHRGLRRHRSGGGPQPARRGRRRAARLAGGPPPDRADGRRGRGAARQRRAADRREPRHDSRHRRHRRRTAGSLHRRHPGPGRRAGDDARAAAARPGIERAGVAVHGARGAHRPLAGPARRRLHHRRNRASISSPAGRRSGGEPARADRPDAAAVVAE